MFKPLLSISMMRCRFLMCQHIHYAHLVIVVYIHIDHKITQVFDTNEYIVLEK